MFSGWFKNNPIPSKNHTSVKGDNFVVSVDSKNVFSFRKANQAPDKPAKFVKKIENWMHNNYFTEALSKDKVIYNASNLIVGPTNAGKTVFISWLINNLLHLHVDKKFFIIIYSCTTAAVSKLRDVMTVLRQPNLIDFDKQVVVIHDLSDVLEMFLFLEDYYNSIDNLIEKTIDKEEEKTSSNGSRCGPFVANSTLQQDLCRDFLKNLQQEFKTSNDDAHRARLQFKIKLIEKISDFTDYIFYFDDCNDLFVKPSTDNNEKKIMNQLVSKIQTTNRHFFITSIYSLQNVKSVRYEGFSNNLANMFVVGGLAENFKSLIERYNVLKMVFANESNMTAFYSSFDQIFEKPKYTIQWFSKNTPDILYWGIIPKKYVEALDAKDERRRTLKRKVNAAVGTLFKDSSGTARGTTPSPAPKKK